jgi:hypothetical protein
MSTREEMMKPVDRRGVLRGMLRGAAIAGVSMALIPNATEAVPLATGHAGRGRRRCGWRWVNW